MSTKNIHVIIAPSPWNDDPLKYRRHRLAVFLRELKETEKVIWIAPVVTDSYKSIGKKPVIEELPNGIIQLKVPDFKSLVKHISVFQGRLRNELLKLTKDSENLYLWYTYPAFSSLCQMKMWNSVIYDCSDNWKEAEQLMDSLLYKVKRKLIIRTETSIIHSAKCCMASSEYLAEHLRQFKEKEVVHLVENGVELHRFDSSSLLQRKHNEGEITLGFVGGLKDWKIDFGLLVEVAKKKPEWDIALVGSIYGEMSSTYKELIRLSNVKKVDAVPFEEIPQLLQQFDVGLLPYLNNEYNQGVFPLKFYEYLASGLPVVGCGLPSTKQKVERDVYELVENNSDLFIKACERAISSDRGNSEKRRLVAKSADWNDKLQKIWNLSQH